MRLFLMAMIMMAVQAVTSTVQADSFYIDQNGKRYLCEQVSGGGSSCWDECPYTFGTCADSCGGGSQCWDKCPYTFGTCADSCGGGSSCWDKCPYTFSTCAETCGGNNNNIAPNVLKRMLNTHGERLQFERENLQTH